MAAAKTKKADKEKETTPRIVFLKQDDYKTETDYLKLLDDHIDQAINTDAKTKADFDFLKLDLKYLCRRLRITENILRERLKKFNSKAITQKLEYIQEQLLYSFLESPKTQMNSSLIREYAEHNLNLYSKDKQQMPDITIIQPTADDYADMAETLLKLVKHRYDFDRQALEIKKLKDKKIKEVNNVKN